MKIRVVVVVVVVGGIIVIEEAAAAVVGVRDLNIGNLRTLHTIEDE